MQIHHLYEEIKLAPFDLPSDEDDQNCKFVNLQVLSTRGILVISNQIRLLVLSPTVAQVYLRVFDVLMSTCMHGDTNNHNIIL